MKTDTCIEAVLRSIDTAEGHIRSEYVHDLAATMATVAPQPHYAVTAEPGVVGVISGWDKIAAMYEGAHNFAIPNASRFLTQIASDWYLFVENMPTRKWVPDGSLRTVHTATLLVMENGKVKGEYIWERPPAEVAAPTGSQLPHGQLRSVSLHEAFLTALSSGDRATIGQLLDPQCTWAERDYLSDVEGGAILELHGAAAAAHHLAEWHERYRPQQVSVLNRQATDWYVFAEELWTVKPDDGERRQFRKAMIYPVNSAGRIQGAVGFGTDLEAASSAADHCAGQAFWPEAETDRNKPLQSRSRPASAM